MAQQATPSKATEVSIPPVGLGGILSLPKAPAGLVLFAHGSFSGRFSPRNQQVAETLNQAGLATLLFDLLTADEARDRRHVFDIALLAERLVDATEWVAANPAIAALPLGYFGASTGAAAALAAAGRADSRVAAVVSRGGRPDLAGSFLPSVRAATLLIVGSKDEDVLALNQAAFDRLVCEKQLAIVAGASHLFEEAGALDQVIELARGWFLAKMGRHQAKAGR